MDRDPAPSRRSFFASIALAACAPLLSRCRSRSGGDDDSDSPAEAALAADTPHRSRPPLPAVEPPMRVRVAAARGPGAAVKIGSADQRLRLSGPAVSPGDAEPVTGPLLIGVGRHGWSVTDGTGITVPVDGLEWIDLAGADGGDQALALKKRHYPGTLRLVARTDLDPGAFDVINHVDMESYLPGVVAGELYNHWRIETRAAQAIAARSFAANERAHYRSRRDYDVSATAASQVYLGRVEHEPTIEAVRATRGMVLAYEGRLVSGYYSSCCGGPAALAVDAIGPNPVNDIAPLRGRDGLDVCIDTKIANWTVQRPLETLARRLNAYGARIKLAPLAELGLPAAIEVIRTNPHGRPTRYAVIDTDDKRAEVSAESLRRAANATEAGLKPPPRPLWSSNLAMTVQDDTAIFEGHGFGHGVGLCQYGAETLARRGMAHDDIVRWYYPDVEIVKAY